MIVQDIGHGAGQPSDAQPPENSGVDPNTAPAASDRQPKGDHNRRVSLGMDVDEFAIEAGVTADELREYEQTWPDHEFDLKVASRVGAALDRLEADPPETQKVSNGPIT